MGWTKLEDEIGRKLTLEDTPTDKLANRVDLAYNLNRAQVILQFYSPTGELLGWVPFTTTEAIAFGTQLAEGAQLAGKGDQTEAARALSVNGPIGQEGWQDKWKKKAN